MLTKPTDIGFSTVIISAFITGTNSRADRSIDKYLDFGRELTTATDNVKIVFLSSDVFSQTIGDKRLPCESFRLENREYAWVFDVETNTYYIEFNMCDMYYYGADLSEFSVNTGRPDKDTAEYMMVQNYKPEWMRMGILFTQRHIQQDTTQYMWIDYGIRHMFSSAEHLSRTLKTCFAVSTARYKDAWSVGHPLDRVHFASCHPDKKHWLDVYRDVQWVFAGSVFGGMRGPLLRFAELTKAEIMRIIRERRSLMWEVNVWIIMREKYPYLFSLYSCVHDESILLNY